jgi:chromate reductase, NAD(P)H dehydrogenase (quinone)
LPNAWRERVKVLLVCGSLGATSSNAMLLERIAQQAPPGTELRNSISLAELPFFVPEAEPQAAVAMWRTQLADADVVVIASPEYGHSMPGVVKNAVDWVIGSGELYRKAVAVTASVAGKPRGERGLLALCTTLRAVDANVVWSDTVIHNDTAEVALLWRCVTSKS